MKRRNRSEPQQAGGEGPATYAIWARGALGHEWFDRVGGMEIRLVETGAGAMTELVGALADQSALSGVLKTLYDLGLSIVSVERLAECEPAKEDEE